jgi:DNA repair exonuclease SbcCD nuclease subunit
MANLLFWSDLHLEFAPFDLPNLLDFDVKPDALLLAGDTSTQMRHLDFALTCYEAYDCPIVLIDGNHEFYGGNIDMIETEEDIWIAEMYKLGIPIHILRGDAIEISGTRIAGATLWTDFDIWPDLSVIARQVAAGSMNDFHLIKSGTDNSAFTINQSINRHQAEKQKLIASINTPFDGPTVVMTHHIPVKDAVHQKYWRDPLTAAFANNMISAIEDLPFDHWIYGHSHENLEFSVNASGRTRNFVSNPRGYPNETTRFDPLRMICT